MHHFKFIVSKQIMAKFDFRAKCLTAVVMASLFAVRPAMADKPSGAGHNREGQHEQDFRSPGREDYRERDYNRGRDWDGGRHYRDQPRREHGDWQHARSHDDKERSQYRGGSFFVDQHRTYVHDYYYDHYRGRRCPPGLAKKHNGCMPPGQARKWAIGRPLPRNVIFYDLPPALITGIGYPPPGYRFVRVASDILMIAVGTGIVMDAIQDLGGGW
jgi:hypothetical protein